MYHSTIHTENLRSPDSCMGLQDSHLMVIYDEFPTQAQVTAISDHVQSMFV